MRSSQTIQIILVVVILAVIGVVMSMNSSSTTNTLTETVVDNGGESAVALKMLNDINGIRLEARIFENPAFQALVDTSRAIKDEPRGRSNPFAPLEQVSVQSTQSKTAKQVIDAE